MIKCLACNSKLSRLQWTHFRYKCNGEFKNIKDYRKAYPEAKIVDDELAKRTAVTKKTLINKYGKVKGQHRWSQYKQRQADSNSFEYKKKHHGWNKKTFNDYNKSRAVTLDNLVKKHGVNKGTLKWLKYCERQAYTNTLEYFIEREGSKEKGLETYLRINREKQQPHDPHYLAKQRNITLDEACEIISSRKLTKGFYSKMENLFVDELENELEYIFPYSCKTVQFSKWSHELNQPIMYDICCPKRKKIIEFHGDYWHANPNQYKHNWNHPHLSITASDIWERDQIRKQPALSDGYKIYTIWEGDYIKNKDEVIKAAACWFYGLT